MKEERTRIAAALLCIETEKATDVPREVQARVRAMPQAERDSLSSRITGVIEWVAAYEAAEGAP